MSKRLVCFAGVIALFLASAAMVLAQDTTGTTTTTTTVTSTTQNPDGSYTVVQYPVGQQVTVDLMPGATLSGAKGIATVMRNGDLTNIKVDLSGLPGDATSYNLYAVDPAHHFTLLGPISVAGGTATYTTTTPLDKFMLVLSPDANLASFGPSTNIAFRSAVPTGLAVMPYAQNGPTDTAPIGSRVAATSSVMPTSAYNVPMLDVPGFRRGKHTTVKVNFAGELAGSRANVNLKPRNDGPTEIQMRFHELKRVPANTRLVLWAVGSDNHYTKIGQIINTGDRNEGEIRGETALPDFGLLVTVENTEDLSAPRGTVFATVTPGM